MAPLHDIARQAGGELPAVIAAGLSDEAKALLLDRLSFECYLTGQITEAVSARESSYALWKAAGNRYKEGDSLRWLSRLMWFTTNPARSLTRKSRVTHSTMSARANLLRKMPVGETIWSAA